MNIDDLTIGEAREIAALAGGKSTANAEKAADVGHPFAGLRVLAILPHGFIYYGKLMQRGPYFKLEQPSNLRYWTKRDGGLPEFAEYGPKDGDRIDECHGSSVAFEHYVAMIPLGDWNE